MFCSQCGEYQCSNSHREPVSVNDTVTNSVKRGERIKAVRRW